jgi:hypothetical protein
MKPKFGKVLDSRTRGGSSQMKLSVLIALIATVLTGSVATALAASPSPSGEWTANKVEALALEWFAHMQSGQIDRTQLAAKYSAQSVERIPGEPF